MYQFENLKIYHSHILILSNYEINKYKLISIQVHTNSK